MKARVCSYLAAVLILSSCSIFPKKQVQDDQPAEKIPTASVVAPAKPVVTPEKKQQLPIAPPVVAPKPIVPAVPPVPAPPAVVKPVKPQMPGCRISRVAVPDKVVALTFDDGPHGALTPRVLDILDRYNAKGTFFVLGSNARLHPALLRRMSSSGHEIGNHTWNHMNMSRTSRDAIAADLAKTNDAIVSACGVKPRLMRPPYGAGNAALSSWMKESIGATTVLWDVDTNDWRKPGVQTVINRAVNGARPGSIILVHDIHKSTVDAVEGIVRGLQARGFKLVTVSDLMNRGRNYANKAELLPAAPIAPAPVEESAPVAEAEGELISSI